MQGGGAGHPQKKKLNKTVNSLRKGGGLVCEREDIFFL